MTTILLNHKIKSIEVMLDERYNIGLAIVTAQNLFHVGLCVSYRAKYL